MKLSAFGIAAFLALSTVASVAQAGPPQGSVQPSPGGPDATKQDLNKSGPASSTAPMGNSGVTGAGSNEPSSSGIKGNVNPGSQKSGSEPAGEPANQPRK